MDRAAWNRLAVGFFSALGVPAIKIVQNGVGDLATVTPMVIIGFSVPIFIMAAVCGVYAVFIEKEETDMKRLFRMCVTLPAFMTSMAGGVTSVPDVSVGMSEASAQVEAAPTPAAKEVVCSVTKGFRLGLASSFSTLTDRKFKRYWLLSKSPSQGRCVKVDKECWTIVRSVDEVDPKEIYMDKLTCKLIQTEEKAE